MLNLKQLQTILFFLLLTLSLVFCFILLTPFFNVIAWAILLSVIAQPIYNKLLARINNPTFASIVTCLFLVLIVVIPFTFLLFNVINEGISLIKHIQPLIKDGEWIKNLDFLKSDYVKSFYSFANQYFNVTQSDLEALIIEKIEGLLSVLLASGAGTIKSIITGIFHFFITLLTTFFLLKDSKQLLHFIRTFIPLDEELTNSLLNRAGKTIFVTVYVAIIVAFVQGSLGGLAFLVLGIPSPLLWGGVMTFFCLIPFLGAPVIWLPASVILMCQDHSLKAISLALWGMLVIGWVDNLIRSVLISSYEKLHPLLIFFSVFGGVLFMGPIGLFMGPLILVLTIFLLEVLKVKLKENV